MEALLATPISISEFLIGKITPYFILGVISMAISVAVAVFVFGVPFRGSFLILAALSAIFLIAALGQGLFISTVTRNQLVAAQISIMTAFLPAFYFSNFVFEIDSMPAPLQWLSLTVPARYYVSSLQSLFLAGDVAPVIIADSIGLAATAVAFMALTALATKKRLA